MANTQKYLNHLLQTVGITPACSEEERVAAEEIARIFSNHGFEPEIQEFTSSSSPKLIRAILGCVLFVATVLMGIGGALGVVGTILVIACGAIFILERLGRISLPQIGAGGLSQNVIAYHKASGPLASPRNRPVVVVAHYDSPRADILAQAPFAAYRPLLVKLLPVAMVVPAIIGILRIFPLPGAAKIVLWVLAILVSLIPLFNAVAIILNRHVLPYTSGSVCNKSSVAAMLGVMDAVAPFQGADEFPEDRPFDEYMEEQQSLYAVESYTDDSGVVAVPYGDNELVDGAEADDSDAAFDDEFADEGADELVEDGFTIVPDIDYGADDEVAEEEIPLTGATITMPALQDDQLAEAADDKPVEADEAGAEEIAQEAAEEEPVEDEEPGLPVNEAGCIRYGVDALRSLGMVAASCAIEYEEGALPVPAAARAAHAVADVAQAASAVSAAVPVVPAAPVVDIAPEIEDAPVVEPEPAVEPEVEAEPEFASADDDVVIEPTVASEEFEAYEAEDAEEVDELEEYDEDEWAYDESELDGAVDAAYETLDDEDELVEDESAFDESADEETGEEEPVDSEYADEEVGVEEFVDDETFDGEESEENDEDAFYAGETNVFEPLSDEDIAAAEDAVEPAEDEAIEGEEPVDADAEEEPADASGDADEEAFFSGETNVFEPLSDEDIAADEGEAESVYDDDVDIMEAIYEVLDDDEPVDGEEADDVLADSEDAVELEKTSTFVPMDPTLARDDEDEPVEADDDAAEDDEMAYDVDGILADDDDDDADKAEVNEPAADQQVPLGGATQVFDMSTVLQGTQPFSEKPVDATQPRRQDTVDSLMAEITAARPQRPQRAMNIPDIASNAPQVTRTVPPVVPAVDPAPRTIAGAASAANRASLLDLPDPSSLASDPFANVGATGNVHVSSPSTSQFTVINSDDVVAPSAPAPGTFDTIKAPAPQPVKKKKRGLFGRKKKQDESSMSDWLGVDSNYDAKRSGRDIGSWDNFEGDDGWKGGAASDGTLSETELREAITSLGDDELLGHDIWFVATGSSENGNAGARAFLESHRDRLRGVFLINLECVGSGMLAMVSTEGERRVLKGDKRIMGLISRVSSDFHHAIGAVDMPFVDTDAHAAMEMSLRSVTLGGVDGTSFACSHSTEDIPVNINTDNIDLAADVVTEVIRRS